MPRVAIVPYSFAQAKSKDFVSRLFNDAFRCRNTGGGNHLYFKNKLKTKNVTCSSNYNTGTKRPCFPVSDTYCSLRSIISSALYELICRNKLLVFAGTPSLPTDHHVTVRMAID